ncbi:transcription initiation factor TFIIIB [Mycoplasmatota bacterium zrk1]
MNHNYTKVCSKCNSNDIKYGKQHGHANVIGKGFSSSLIHYYVCGKCGYVVDQFVDKPNKMKNIRIEL